MIHESARPRGLTTRSISRSLPRGFEPPRCCGEPSGLAAAAGRPKHECGLRSKLCDGERRGAAGPRGATSWRGGLVEAGGRGGPPAHGLGQVAHLPGARAAGDGRRVGRLAAVGADAQPGDGAPAGCRRDRRHARTGHAWLLYAAGAVQLLYVAPESVVAHAELLRWMSARRGCAIVRSPSWCSSAPRCGAPVPRPGAAEREARGEAPLVPRGRAA